MIVIRNYQRIYITVLIGGPRFMQSTAEVQDLKSRKDPFTKSTAIDSIQEVT